jgi:hypothetical protein
MIARAVSHAPAVTLQREARVDITQLILDDHHEQRRLFAILEQIDRSDIGSLSAVWGRLAAFLEVHAAAEEAIFYPALLKAGIAAKRKAGVEDETLDAIHDHNEIRDAVEEECHGRPGGGQGPHRLCRRGREERAGQRRRRTRRRRSQARLISFWVRMRPPKAGPAQVQTDL